MKPTTAVIFAAGSGTRMLPITAAVQKELLPILNRPVADYIVADLVAGGITRIIFVIRPGQTGLKDYYLGNPGFEAGLQRLGKTAELELLAGIHAQATFEFVEQPETAGYGTAVPLQVALPLLDPSQPVLVCSGDDFVWNPSGASETAAFIETYTASQAAGALMALELPESALSHYGTLATKEVHGAHYLTDIVEKPTPGSSPSHLANISKYILSGKLHEYIQNAIARPGAREIYITDAIVAAAKQHPIVVHQISGTYLDTGNTASWLHANQVVAASLAPSKPLEK